VQGKHIAFVGDRGNRGYPVPFILPPQNTWIWIKAKYLCNTARFGTFYGGNDTKDKLWLTGASKAKLTETPLPCLLALPKFIAEFLGKQGGACLPHKLQNIVSDHINGGELQSHQTNGNLYWIGALPQHRGEMTEQASATLGHQNWHCARTRSLLSGASCAPIQPWGRKHNT
jgi:hypothetical protein